MLSIGVYGESTLNVSICSEVGLKRLLSVELSINPLTSIRVYLHLSVKGENTNNLIFTFNSMSILKKKKVL